MVAAGPPALLIVDTAKDIGTDLIVMGTRGRAVVVALFWWNATAVAGVTPSLGSCALGLLHEFGQKV
jgi:hypothetical protein